MLKEDQAAALKTLRHHYSELQQTHEQEKEGLTAQHTSDLARLKKLIAQERKEKSLLHDKLTKENTVNAKHQTELKEHLAAQEKLQEVNDALEAKVSELVQEVATVRKYQSEGVNMVAKQLQAVHNQQKKELIEQFEQEKELLKMELEQEFLCTQEQISDQAAKHKQALAKSHEDLSKSHHEEKALLIQQLERETTSRAKAQEEHAKIVAEEAKSLLKREAATKTTTLLNPYNPPSLLC